MYVYAHTQSVPDPPLFFSPSVNHLYLCKLSTVKIQMFLVGWILYQHFTQAPMTTQRTELYNQACSVFHLDGRIKSTLLSDYIASYMLSS